MVATARNNPEIERRCLSTLFFGAEEVNAAVRDGLTPEAFDHTKNRTIFRALVESSAEDRATDIVTVWRKLSGMTGDLEPIGVHELASIEGLEPTSARRALFVSDVLGLWYQRKLVAAISAALEAASAPAPDWILVWEATEPHLRAAQQSAQRVVDRSLSDMAQAVHDRIVNGDTRAVVATGLTKWDAAASPLRAGELAVIAARPGCGKTAIALQMAGFNSKGGGGATAFFSLEMAGEELVMRLASAEAGTAGIRDPKLRGPAALAIGNLKALRVFDGHAAATIAQIEARCRLLSCTPSGLRAVFVDYLQLIAPPADTRRDNRERQVAELSRRFKLLAGELKCPVVLLAQINRESEKDQRKPRLSDLRESGAIEQDADRVWFLYQAEDKKTPYDESASEVKVTLYQAKCRNGRPGLQTVLNFNRPIFTFTTT